MVLIMLPRRKEEEEEEKKRKNMQNSGLRLSDTVCTAPLGPINMHGKVKLIIMACQSKY